MPPSSATTALIDDSELASYEVEESIVSSVIEVLFDDIEEQSTEDGGSPHQQWYKRIAVGKDAILDDATKENGAFENSRLIAWKKGKPFKPENLFFRTIDTGRLLPMSLADFRVQFYAHESIFEKLREVTGGKEKWMGQTLTDYLPKILVLRNMHDQGGGDIPLITTSWTVERTQQALDYWVDLSKGKWSDDERRRRWTECDNHCRRNLPCFYQIDLLVRALLSDPAVGYVPPFIIFHSVLTEGRTVVLFTKPLHAPPPALVRGRAGAAILNVRAPTASRST